MKPTDHDAMPEPSQHPVVKMHIPTELAQYLSTQHRHFQPIRTELESFHKPTTVLKGLPPVLLLTLQVPNPLG